MNNEYKPTKEYAKEIRQELKVAYPSTKFSVRTNEYSMGSSIDVNWTDGPTQKQVEAIANAKEDIDRDEYGEILSGGNRFVFCHRDYSVKYGSLLFRDVDLTDGKAEVSIPIFASKVSSYLSTNRNFKSYCVDKEEKNVVLEYNYFSNDISLIRELAEVLNFTASLLVQDNTLVVTR